jgi:hypothetical protein
VNDGANGINELRRLEEAHGQLPTTPQSQVRRLLRDPLLHFLLVGALIFAVYALLNPAANRTDQANRIVLTKDDLRQLAVHWLAQGRPPPTADEMRALVGQKVSEEILFREAVALGLDKNDEIIKRRLAQKMDFLAADVAALQAPGDAELRAWFAQNASRFALPPRASFRHLYFSSDRGPGARDAAAAVLGKIAGKPADAPEVAAVADRFMFQDYYAERAPDQVAKEFGPYFAKALFDLKPGMWQGPIQSATAGISSSSTQSSKAACPRSRKSSPMPNPRGWIKGSVTSNGSLSKRCVRATRSLSRRSKRSTWEACGFRRRQLRRQNCSRSECASDVLAVAPNRIGRSANDVDGADANRARARDPASLSADR